ncbi:MAG: adenosine deaminase [Deltaproteobacteria bacterium RIFCSPLOWO2_01_44_7]|nr:MAG: adenosine deaminase [Deltaproteobacteria bacterium RIFCSPHIGHO2_01_FULL_43_49]OGQ14610.1 MAG: adenosine deaminase [Deltaproteobacteria bacterium RIFCSPHIGHO2_02_FULL_44_53]OGQ27996.1 MAG: adenosine deaminase [Deltaproteobacteria bacterium RIFCSPHIGHO2_12_FULL_44_21]OGQ31208.1 MAG: adenosine deaminase [Deltaproteobacteria bacterium RIFCSPLOWO2_01_FULL_45_74]OGQ40419.1 MAG: adenosine deaminase [Deltaproteobacteria bacterium RIFCSPLOWO2_01_44_7]OGQ43200.1 MAG: adenosine deaminase [Deltapr
MKNNKQGFSKEFIRAIPKSDLHVHLDGSLRLGTLIELAQKQKIKLPSYTEEGMKELVFKESYADLGEYLHGFKYTCAVLRDKESLEKVSYELAIDNFNEGVRYIEPRFAPQLNAHRDLSILEVIQSVDKGLARAKKEIAQQPAVKSGAEPPFEYGIIGCAMRKFDERFSDYYKDFISIHTHTPPKELYPIASLEVAHALVSLRDDHGLPVVGFDIAGEEKGYPAGDHVEAFHFAHKHFLKKTVHAGEAYGPPSIFQAITDCRAERIGHGTHLFAHDLIDDMSPKAKRFYTEQLAQYIADQRITIEVCLTSNLQTIPTIKDFKNHPLGKMLDHKLSVSLCTDNRLVSHTTMCDEIERAIEAFHITPAQLKNIILYGFKRSFFSHPYTQKRDYVYKIIDHYEAVEKKFGITHSS